MSGVKLPQGGAMMADRLHGTWPPKMPPPDDAELLDRTLALLHRFATENTGWRAWFVRWYYSDEPLRNDAANLVRLAGFGMPMPLKTRLVGDQE